MFVASSRTQPAPIFSRQDGSCLEGGDVGQNHRHRIFVIFGVRFVTLVYSEQH